MNVLTPSCYFSFYPNLTDSYRCLVREMSPAPVEEVWENVDLCLRLGYDISVDNGNERLPCVECPTTMRRTRGAKDITSVVWRRSHAHRFDEYVETVDTRFQIPHANIVWQWSKVCFNPVCPYFTTCVFHHSTGIFRAMLKAFHSRAIELADVDRPYTHAEPRDTSFAGCAYFDCSHAFCFSFSLYRSLGGRTCYLHGIASPPSHPQPSRRAGTYDISLFFLRRAVLYVSRHTGAHICGTEASLYSR